MTQPIGTLIQPYTKVVWDDLDLTYWTMPDGVAESLVHSVEVKFEKGEQAPMAKMRLNAHPEAFKVFQEIKETRLSKTFSITLGYMGGNTFTTNYRFAGMRMTTGHNPMLEIIGVSVVKGAWTDNKVSYTMEESISLHDFPKWLLDTHCPDMKGVLKFVFVGQGVDVAKKIMVKHAQVQRTCHNILVDVLRQHGFDAQLGDNAFAGEIVISYSPALAGELEADKPSAKGGSAQPGKRNIYICGPGLMENLTRDQTYNVGQTTTKRASSTTANNSYETDATQVVQPDSAPQQNSATTQNPYGTTGPANPPSSATGTTKPDPQAEAKRAAFSKLLTTKVGLSCEMLPRVVGIKPRDVLVVPSLKGPGSYLEDWEVVSTSYKQNAKGGVRISVQGRRPYTGGIAMLDEASVEEVQAIVEELTTPEEWAAYYWVANGTNKAAMPLAN